MKKSIKDNLIAYSFIAPNFIGFAIFTLAPLFFALALSFMRWDGSNPIKWAGFENFSRLFKDIVFWVAVRNTFIYTLGVVPLTMACALLLAVLLNQKIFARNFFRTVAFFPYVASLVAVTAVWNFLFSPTRGPVNNFLSFLLSIPVEKLPKWAADRNWALPTVIFFSVWKNMGYYMIIYLAGLQGINADYYEAASIEGAGKWQKFRHITLPQLAPTTFFIIMILVIYSFKVYDIFINIFAGQDNQLTDATRVLVYQIYNTAFRINEFGYASSIAMVLLVLVVCITIFQFRLERKFSIN
ncbi:MAG: sugar ABC transporter permease [Treponema sp.]|jgi:multiple sugar transport system permease protein|nr:sugar ABC transporter permease [Treponema sp.]